MSPRYPPEQSPLTGSSCFPKLALASPWCTVAVTAAHVRTRALAPFSHQRQSASDRTSALDPRTYAKATSPSALTQECLLNNSYLLSSSTPRSLELPRFSCFGSLL
jgi:hypothetical protein